MQIRFSRAHREHGVFRSHYVALNEKPLKSDLREISTFFFCFRQPSQPRPEGTPGILLAGKSHHYSLSPKLCSARLPRSLGAFLPDGVRIT